MKIDTLGVDLGGVVISRADRHADTSFFGPNFLETPPVAGSFEAIARLVAERFAGRAYVVSKCGPRIQDCTRRWLDHHRFHELTGIPRENLHFCRERREKAGICREIGATHFVDDLLEILASMTSVGTRYLFQARKREVRRYASALPQVRRVETWEEIVRRELG